MNRTTETHSVLSESYRNDYLKACKIIVAGGRDFENYEFMSAKLDEIFERLPDFKEHQITIYRVWQEELTLLLFVMQTNVI